MKAMVFEGPGAMKVRSVPEPTLRSGEVMVRPLVTAVCLTDVASYDGWYPLPATHPDSYPSELPGIIIGHEASAEIIEVGPDVTHWAIGERVAIEPTVFCGQCALCKVGLYEACTTIAAPKQALGINSQNSDGTPRYHGLLAEYAAVPVEMLYRVPDAVSPTAAASIEVLGIAYTRLRASNARIGDDVVVFGAAFDYLVLGQLAALSAANVIVIDPFAVRRNVAKKFFEHVVDPTTTDVVEYVHSVMPAGADVTFTGADTLDSAVAVTRTRGMLSVAPVGSWQPRRADPELIKHQRVRLEYLPRLIQLAPPTMIHCHEQWKGGQVRHCYDIVAQLLAQGRLDAESYCRIIPFDRFTELEGAFENYHENQFRVGVRF
jgi:(R,R)-butanediol dehydrogenase/meso-butanediol dehydrogenase/diacetyl reductase